MIVGPTPIRTTDVDIHDISMRSTLTRRRNEQKRLTLIHDHERDAMRWQKMQRRCRSATWLRRYPRPAPRTADALRLRHASQR